MKKITKQTLNKALGAIALGATLAFSVAPALPALAVEAPATVKVTIVKYVGNEMATAESADSNDFQMSATWNAENIGPGTGTYALSETGFNSPDPYTAVTSDMTTGADYSTSEVMDATTGATCGTEEASSTTPFALAGYTWGDTMEEAAAGTPSLTPPAFTDLDSDKFVIVWNTDCSAGPVEPPTPETVQVHIKKYVDGEQATNSNASSTEFTMNATWASTSHGSGTGTYNLGPSSTVGPYQEETVHFNPGANYSTSEITTGDNVGPSCAAEKPFALVGYTTGESFAAAASSSPTLVAPAFAGMSTDKYVIVWNEDCSDTATSTGGTIGGDVVEASSTLAVTSIDTVDGSAVANGTFEDGWVYVFHITVPTDEQDLSMKFSDWTNGSSTIPVANNMRISSEQADATSTVLLTAADTYSTPPLHITEDIDPATPGWQVEVKVEVAVPTGTPNGSYTTNYGVRSL